MRAEPSAAVPGQPSSSGNLTSDASSKRGQPQASSSSHPERLFYSPNTPASYQPVTGGVYDSEQSTSRDQDSIMPDSCPTAYTLEWGPHMPCTRTPLDVDAVGASRRHATPGSVQVIDQSSVSFIRHAWKCNEDMQSSASAAEAGPSYSQEESSQKLFVIRGTKDEDINRTICSVLDIDPAFLAAHVAGQRYRPRERPWRVGAGKSTTFTASSYVYPQTLTVTLPSSQVPASSRDMGAEGHADGTHTAVVHNSNGNMEQSQDGGEKAPETQAASVTAIEASNTDHISLLAFPRSSKDKTVESPVAMFCRASLWTSARANVLLLDRSPSSTSLEDALFNALDDTGMVDSIEDSDSSSSNGTSAVDTVADSLCNALSGLAYEQWMDFVDTLSSNNRGAKQGWLNKRLFWDMAQYLEQNLATSRVLEKKLLRQKQQWKAHHEQDDTELHSNLESNFSSPDDWRALLSRLERTVALLPLQNYRSPAAVAGTNTARFRAADTSFTVNRTSSGDIDSLTTHGSSEAGVGSKTSDTRRTPAGAINAKRRPSFSQTPEGQNALNRITYMGGILLPFSIIAGVLSMSDPFGPGDRLFWVFWIITLPITGFTLSIIYADDIRKKYIWKPMSHESLQKAINKGEALPAAVAAALARAADKVIDKFSAVETDSDIESEPVLSAVRPAESPDGTGRPARVRVNTNSGPGGPTLYRLSEREQPGITAAVSISRQQPAQSSLAASGPIVSPSGNVEIQTAVAHARARRRLGILGPLRRAWPSSSKPNTDPSAFPDDIEPAIAYDKTAVIEMARPNVDPRIAELFGPPEGINVAAPGCPAILVSEQRKESDPAAWRRQQLGWSGAFQKMSRYLKTRDA
ncbi:hypothetical protein SEUCBS139899_007172 [Sporothrix eucalyptigena]|uniref:Uncharacterized protein n=1 Tax=Sporothrix eucalyptigena TaxID=1812306 RepID=A0ABP0C3R7_9PEZI